MISEINKSNLLAMKKTYDLFDHTVNLTEEIMSDLEEAFSVSHARLVHTETFDNFCILLPYNKKLSINPWFFNGCPIGADQLLKKQLIEQCKSYFYQSSFRRLELITTLDEKIDLPLIYDYADMHLALNHILHHEKLLLEIKTITEFPVDILKALFHKCFVTSDAKFYGLLDPEEQINFWSYLDYEEAVLNPCSVAILENDNIIGFAFVIDYGTLNKHVTCMCVDPDFQDHKVGQQLLSYILDTAIKSNFESITLGTETQMKAYHLYKKYGFNDTIIKHNYILKNK